MFDYLALLAFVAFMVGTPGPANLVLMIAGMRQGLWGSLSFIFGLILGKILLNILIGSGFGVVLASYPKLQSALTYMSAAYMIFLATRSWPQSKKVISRHNSRHPKTYNFREGFIIHPLNPKAWLMVVLAWGNFAPALGAVTLQFLAVTGSFVFCQLVFHSLWCGLGEYVGNRFANNERMTKVMILLTILMILAALNHMQTG